MKQSRFTDSQIIRILKANEAGAKVADLCREHGMTKRHFTNGVADLAVWTCR